MKICFLNAWGNGSTGRLVERLARMCESNGDQYLSFYGRGKSYLEDAICYNTKANLYCDVIRSRLLDNQGLNSVVPTKKILKRIDQFKPDVIHIHNLHGYWINYNMLFDYIREKGIRVIWTLHDSWPMTGHCACYSYLNCNNFNHGCGSCPGTRQYPAAIVDRSRRFCEIKSNIFSSVKQMIIVTPSEWMKRNVEGSKLSAYPVHVIHNQIDDSVFHYQTDCDAIRHELGIPNEKKIVLYVSMNTSDPWKGFNIFKETIGLLSTNFHTIIVGECDIQSSEVVSNMGRINDPKRLAKIYSVADVLANPSLDDNYPTVNLEALACGLPVAAFETGGIPEQIRWSCGSISKEKTATALVDSIVFLTGQNRYLIRKKCLKRYQELSNEKNFIEQYVQLYHLCLME